MDSGNLCKDIELKLKVKKLKVLFLLIFVLVIGVILIAILTTDGQSETPVDIYDYSDSFAKVFDECSLETAFSVDKCITREAIDRNDLQLCTLIVNLDMQKTCLAAIKNDKSLCQGFLDAFLEQMCIEEIDAKTFGIPERDEELEAQRREELVIAHREELVIECGLESYSHISAGLCLSNKAIEKNDFGACMEIPKEEIRAFCVAVLKHDLDLCKELPESGGEWGEIDLRQRCISTINSILLDYTDHN